jgi:signal transduction histidine kinase
MVAAISHDLRTPITRLRLRAEFVDDADQQRKLLADLDEMEAIINSTLGFTREESDPEPSGPLDLKALLEEVASGHQGATFAEVPADGFDIRGRKVALKRCFDNLVGNAIRYGRRARIRLSSVQGRHRVTIEDDGPGIPEDRLEDVFRPFVRLEASRNRESGGAGLGLTIARSIVLAHGGTIRLSNRPEGGLASVGCGMNLVAAEPAAGLALTR